jgi:hypothetical protein
MRKVRNIKTNKIYYGVFSKDKETMNLFTNKSKTKKIDLIATRKEIMTEYESIF